MVSRGIAPAKVRVIYNGVNPLRVAFTEQERDHIREEVGVPPGGRLVGIVASLTPAKDHETLLKAAALVSRQLPETRFAVVGDGPLRPALEAQARQLNLDSHVVFLGHQLRAGAYIASFDVAVLSSSDLEGCSNFLVEAMALGRPLVATDVGGNRELFTHGQAGLLVPPRDEKAMAESILTILNRPDLMEQMAREGQAIYDARFTVTRMVQAYESLYLELWGRKAGRGRSGG